MAVRIGKFVQSVAAQAHATPKYIFTRGIATVKHFFISPLSWHSICNRHLEDGN